MTRAGNIYFMFIYHKLYIIIKMIDGVSSDTTLFGLTFVPHHTSSITLYILLLSVNYIKCHKKILFEIIVSVPHLWLMSPSIFAGCWCKMVSLERSRSYLIVRDWHHNLTFTAAVAGSRNMSRYKNQSQLHWRHNVTQSVFASYPQRYENTTNKQQC